jgi:glycosyltransferase involved in cell wall biosynthesis
LVQRPLAVVVLTHNEEQNLPSCLASVRGLDADVIVVDSGSNDRTLAIAESHGARVITHGFATHARQWRWALDHGASGHEWVLGLDADQRLTPELGIELGALFGSKESRLSSLDGLFIKRRQIFRGRWIRHGGYYPKYMLKLFRLAKVQIDERDLMDHHFYVQGKVGKLQYDLIEDNQNEHDVAFWIVKHTRYAALHAQEEVLRGQGDGGWLVRPTISGNPDEQVAWLKQRWYRLPLFVRPFLYFFYRYVLRLGFLDGKEGLIFHFLQGCWYRFMVDVKLDELRRGRELTGPGG